MSGESYHCVEAKQLAVYKQTKPAWEEKSGRDDDEKEKDEWGYIVLRPTNPLKRKNFLEPYIPHARVPEQGETFAGNDVTARSFEGKAWWCRRKERLTC